MKLFSSQQFFAKITAKKPVTDLGQKLTTMIIWGWIKDKYLLVQVKVETYYGLKTMVKNSRCLVR